MSDLSDAVRALTRPVIEHVSQYSDYGVYRKPVHHRSVPVEHPPLLVQLEQAVTSAIGNGGGGGSATGNVLNGEALYRAAQIRSAIGDWCRLAGIHPTRNMVADLERWHTIFKQGNPDGGFYLGQMRGWANSIRNLIDPPKRVPVDVPCPVCSATNWVNEEGNTSPNPVVFEYRPEDALATVRATCRACGLEWDSLEAVEELGEEIAERMKSDTPA